MVHYSDNANTLYLCLSTALMFSVDRLSGRGSLSNCLSSSCDLFLWESGQRVGSSVVLYEPGSALGRAGDLWSLGHTWHKQCRSVSCSKTGLGGCWPAPSSPGPAGWGESPTRRGCMGCARGLSPAATADLRGLLSAPAENHRRCLPGAWFLEEQGTFLWLSDMWKFRCAALRPEKLATPFVRWSRQSAAEICLALAHGGGRPRRLSSWISVHMGVRVKQPIQEVVCFGESQTGSLTCLFPKLLVTNQFAQQELFGFATITT